VTRDQQAGFALSGLLTLSSFYFYVDAYNMVSTDRSLTVGPVFIAVPVVLCLVGGALYGILIFLHTRRSPRAH